MLEYTVLGDIATLTEIHYDPDVRNSIVPKDVEFVKDYYEMSDENEAELLRLSRYVLRIELDQQMCYDKKIQMNEIVRQIHAVYGQDLNAIVTDDNAEDLVIRVRIVNDAPSDPRADEEGNTASMEDDSLLEEDWVLLKRLEKVGHQNNMCIPKPMFACFIKILGSMNCSHPLTVLGHVEPPQAAWCGGCEKSLHARWGNAYRMG
jgi:hypothetical protein